MVKWLTGYDNEKLEERIKTKIPFKKFLEEVVLKSNANLITRVICGHWVEEIENLLTQKVRYLDKIVEELVKGVRWKIF